MKRNVRLLSNKYYLWGEVLIRIVSTNAKENRVIIIRYDTFEREHMEFDTAPMKLEPVFKIGEVARFLQRKESTLRKYENLGYIRKARKFQVSKNGKFIRLYSEEDLFELAEFFALQPPPGRPQVKRNNSKIDRVNMMKELESRFKEIK